MQFTTINPYTNEVLETFDAYDDEKINQCLALAEKAFKKWKTPDFGRRSDLFFKLAELLRTQSTPIGQVISREMGKPIRDAKAEVNKCATACEYYAHHAPKFLADEMMESSGSKSYVMYEPLGAVLAVMPWNFPFWQVFRFAAPALMAGNVGVLKHARNTTRCGIRIEELFLEAGFPAGVFQALIIGSEQVAQVIAHDTIKAVTLTGSEAAGAATASTAGKHIKKTVLELGGSDAFIVLPDADLEKAATIAVQSRMINTGQSCIAAKRFIVSDKIVADFTEMVKRGIDKLAIGDPLQETTEIGPMARRDLVEDLHQQVQRSVSMGAQIATGGTTKDAFYTPTLLTGVKPGMPAFDEELFGPVMSIITYSTEEEAIELANNSIFGLGSSIWTQDLNKAQELARKIEAGAVFINALVHSDPRLPFGGIKKSGYGRELSYQGIREFTNIKTVYVG